MERAWGAKALYKINYGQALRSRSRDDGSRVLSLLAAEIGHRWEEQHR